MIVVTLIFGAIATFISFIYIEKIMPRLICTLIAGIILLGSVWGVVSNYHGHFGMYKVTTATTQRVYSTDPTGKTQMLLFQPIGTAGKENVYIYAKKAHAKKTSHTKADEYTNNKLTRTTNKKAYLKRTEVRWRYKSAAFKFWFGIAGNNNQLVKRTNRFYVPKTWFVLTVKQAKELKKQMSDQKRQAELKEQATIYVKGKMQAAIAKDPTLMTNTQQQKKLSQQFAAEYQEKAMRELITELK
ncbi:DUF4811 domain-containing protein [Liquorilactobacillus capillatus]|uniref:DUF4811 domain-containing protein n=1 Tax=Liquorilactobacillus capillatus DSM 19910 TaxID=1423731 RepID=A0A0R1M6S2_9LACO|nr:DUF4811 domain-containing protein [Liquorilactobacillus capillatus]KRL03593.1 hypothetical protein FC81_GL001849 [Liquorilactobacillus capillatus DSM 19910]